MYLQAVALWIVFLIARLPTLLATSYTVEYIAWNIIYAIYAIVIFFGLWQFATIFFIV